MTTTVPEEKSKVKVNQREFQSYCRDGTEQRGKEETATTDFMELIMLLYNINLYLCNCEAIHKNGFKNVMKKK
ncbi:hypothetical protein M514_15109 [Trichuris suis]|uniref:Uncharacterized protein n=1 Tax=Trichuris suis TaxID=68888 RepID=A0A085NTA9_9BILA|nr:hypothetical protein M514_15109 [Trichuris suis]